MDYGKHTFNDPAGRVQEHSRLERIKQYIDENLSQDLRADTVSREFELSVSSLLHIFKKKERQTYHLYVEKAKMNKAMQMIQSGKWIQEVMDATGYKYRSTFHKAFKRKFKYPPGCFGK